MYDAAVCEAVLEDVVLHDVVVAMGVYADVGVVGETVVHDTAEDVVNMRITGNTVNHMIGLCVINPFAIVDGAVGRFWRRKKCEVCHNLTIFLDDIAAVLLHIGRDYGL